MPADLFPAARVFADRRRRASVVPITVGVHVAALLAVLIAPLFADVELPAPRPRSLEYTRVELPKAPRVPPAAPAQQAAAPAPTEIRPWTAPLEAPATIRPESGIETLAGPEPSFGDTAGLGIGDPLGDPAGLSLPPAPAKTPHGPYKVGGDIQQPRRIRYVQPIYPSIAQQARVQGTVILSAVIGADGRVQSLSVLQSRPLLDQAALDAVKQWTFEPTRLNGEPVPVVMTVTVEFRLN